MPIQIVKGRALNYHYEEREIVRQLSGMVASELGEDWRVDSNDHGDIPGAYIDGPEGERLYLRNPSSAVVNVVGYMPEGAKALHLTTRSKEINISRDRGPRIIAREITKRLLPTYRDDLKSVQIKLEANAERLHLQTLTAALLHGAFPGSSMRPDSPAYVDLQGSVNGHIQLSADSSEVLELTLHHLTIEEVLKIADILHKR